MRERESEREPSTLAHIEKGKSQAIESCHIQIKYVSWHDDSTENMTNIVNMNMVLCVG